MGDSRYILWVGRQWVGWDGLWVIGHRPKGYGATVPRAVTASVIMLRALRTP